MEESSWGKDIKDIEDPKDAGNARLPSRGIRVGELSGLMFGGILCGGADGGDDVIEEPLEFEL